jgi:hypothetical protein
MSADMDAAAEAAKKELEELPKDAVEVVRTWWKKHYLTAGHKRLARALLGKETKE